MAAKGVGVIMALAAALAPAAAVRADFVFIEEPPKPVVKPAGGDETLPSPPPSAPAVTQPLAAPAPVAAQQNEPAVVLEEVDLFAATVIPTVPTHSALFDVRAGETVRSAFERWTKEAGWSLIWQADFDLRIEADSVFVERDITEAVPAVLAAFRVGPGQRRLSDAAYRGNRVIVITGKL